MEKNNKYEQMYDILMDYEQKIHTKNQRRIKIGLKCILIIPLIFLILLFWTDSSKIIFLTLWIASLFIIASYLILVEYTDYKLQEKLNELDEDREPQVESLLSADIMNVESSLKSAIKRIDSTLNAEDELKLLEAETEQEELQIEEKKQEQIEEKSAGKKKHKKRLWKKIADDSQDAIEQSDELDDTDAKDSEKEEVRSDEEHI